MRRRTPSIRRFVARVARRFNDENFGQISASLAFATLLSLVAPMLGPVAVLPA